MAHIFEVVGVLGIEVGRHGRRHFKYVVHRVGRISSRAGVCERSGR